MELWVIFATAVLAVATYGLYWLVERLMRSRT